MNARIDQSRDRGHRKAMIAALPLAPSLERRRLQCYLALMLADIVALFAGLAFAGEFYLGDLGLARAMILAQLLLPIYLTIALYNATYSIGALTDPAFSMLRSVVALAISAAAVIFIAFYTKSTQEFSRVIFTLGVLLAGMLQLWLRGQMPAFVAWRCGPHVINQLLIDDGGPHVDMPGAAVVSASEYLLKPEASDPHALDRIGLVLRNMDRVVVSCPPERRVAWAMILKGANVIGEVIDETVVAMGAQGARIAGGMGWLLVSIGPLGLRARIMKRLFDLVLAAGALLVLSPLLLAIAVAILIEDGRPVFFAQQRVGRGNRFFTMYKFRSMAQAHGDTAGMVSTARDDVRVTRVGRFIRRTSIDELPQLFNILRGDMSWWRRSNRHSAGGNAGARHAGPDRYPRSARC